MGFWSGERSASAAWKCSSCHFLFCLSRFAGAAIGVRAEADLTEGPKIATPRTSDIQEGVNYSGTRSNL